MRSTIHIGFPKTGTTSLQQHVFPNLDGVAYLGPNSGPPFSAMAEGLFRNSQEDYEGAALEAFLAEAGTGTNNLLISHEGLGRHHHGGRTAERLHRLLPDSTVVAVVRNQSSLLRSLYYMYLRRGGVHDLEYWAERHLDPDWIRYDAVVADYQRIFGSSRVQVMLYEDFVERPGPFVADFLRLIDADGDASRNYVLPNANQSPSWPSCQAMRTVNRLFRVSACNPRPLIRALPTDAAIRGIRRLDPILFRVRGRTNGRRHEAVLNRLAGEVAASNRRLQELTDLALADHGYPLDDT